MKGANISGKEFHVLVSKPCANDMDQMVNWLIPGAFAHTGNSMFLPKMLMDFIIFLFMKKVPQSL